VEKVQCCTAVVAITLLVNCVCYAIEWRRERDQLSVEHCGYTASYCHSFRCIEVEGKQWFSHTDVLVWRWSLQDSSGLFTSGYTWCAWKWCRVLYCFYTGLTSAILLFLLHVDTIFWYFCSCLVLYRAVLPTLLSYICKIFTISVIL